MNIDEMKSAIREDSLRTMEGAVNDGILLGVSFCIDCLEKSSYETLKDAIDLIKHLKWVLENKAVKND